MPVRRFWCMERQISRIQAERDLRDFTFDASKQDKDSSRKIIDSLTLEIGDTYEIIRPKYVKPDPDAHAKLSRLAG